MERAEVLIRNGRFLQRSQPIQMALRQLSLNVAQRRRLRSFAHGLYDKSVFVSAHRGQLERKKHLRSLRRGERPV